MSSVRQEPSATIGSGWLGTALNAPISNSFLPLIRISLGGCLLWQIWWYFSSDLIRNYYIDPPFHFTWYLLDWIKPWPGSGMYVHFYVLAVAAFCILIGFYYRAAASVFFTGYTYVFLLDRCWYLNHYYLIALLSFIAIFLPAHRRLSVDAWRNPTICTDVAPAWTMWLFRAQVGIPYFYGGIAKLNHDWLRGEPMRTWLAETTDFPIIGRYFTQEWCVYTFVYGGILVDLLAVPLLLMKRTRVAAICVLTLFHLLNARLFHIGVFPWMMIALTIFAFTNPGTWERLLPKVANSTSQSTHGARSTQEHGTMSRTTAIVLGVYLVVQLVAPLRHWLYPGQVAFTREGHTFAWRMKLNRRSVRVGFFGDKADTEPPVPINLVSHVTGAQERKIRDPDMILQLAHHLSSAMGDIPVFVQATVALNNRVPSTFVDPTVDLTTRSRSLWHADWIRLRPEGENP